MGALGTLIIYGFIYAWVWLTTRLKTKKHNIIRISVVSVVFLFNLIGLIDGLSEEEYFLAVFFGIFTFIFGLRLISDIMFIVKEQFEKEETEFKKKLHKAFKIQDEDCTINKEQ